MTERSPSEILLDYAGAEAKLPDGRSRLTLISEDPFVAIGVEGGSETPFLLALPAEAISGREQTQNLKVVSSRNVTVQFEGSPESRELRCSSISFKQFTKAAQLLLDILVESALTCSDQRMVGDLAEDFIELFRPSGKLSFEQILGLFGELLVIHDASDPERMAQAWHQIEGARFDFAEGNERLEVKTAVGPDRQHTFSSRQLPASQGIDLDICSIISDTVLGGVSVVSLFRDIENLLGAGPGFRNVARNFASYYRRNEIDCDETLFDVDQARDTLKLFSSSQIPAPILGEGVLHATWESDLSTTQEAAQLATGLAALVNSRT